jgi:hypothetical protein
VAVRATSQASSLAHRATTLLQQPILRSWSITCPTGAGDAETIWPTHPSLVRSAAKCSICHPFRQRSPSIVGSVAVAAAGAGAGTTATFPAEATGTTCYGPNLRALVCHLVVRQHIPIARVAELLRDAYRIPVSTGTIVAMVKQGAEMLDAFLASLRDTITQAGVVHVDETGLRVDASLHWVHSASTALLTLYHLNTRRGTIAIDAMGVLDRLTGVVVHDGWTPYRKYVNVTHALCNAHHLRELDGAAETEGQQWATEMVAFLADTWQQVLAAKATGATSLTADDLATIRSRYTTIIATVHTANPAHTPTGKRGPVDQKRLNPPTSSPVSTPTPTTCSDSPPTSMSHSTTTKPNARSEWSKCNRRFPAGSAPNPAPPPGSQSAATSPPQPRTASTPSQHYNNSPPQTRGCHPYPLTPAPPAGH